MEVARGGGEEAIRAVLEQHTTEDTRTEPTEVSQQLWFVSHWSGQFSGHKLCHNTQVMRGVPQQMHTHTHTPPHVATHVLYSNNIIIAYIHLCTHTKFRSKESQFTGGSLKCWRGHF